MAVEHSPKEKILQFYYFWHSILTKYDRRIMSAKKSACSVNHESVPIFTLQNDLLPWGGEEECRFFPLTFNTKALQKRPPIPICTF